MPIGRISIVLSESRLNGTLLAVENSSDPLGEATSFLSGRGIHDDDIADITGSDGKIGSIPVIFMIDAQLVEGGLGPAEMTGKESSDFGHVLHLEERRARS
jgi:hypothetical protein